MKAVSIVRKPPTHEGITHAQEISFAMSQAVQVMRDAVRDLVGPLARQIEQLKADLTALEGERAIQRKDIPLLTVEAYWEIRPCFVCSERRDRVLLADGTTELREVARYGPCAHREIEVAHAEIERTRRSR